jgi:hypothetical protein
MRGEHVIEPATHRHRYKPVFECSGALQAVEALWKHILMSPGALSIVLPALACEAQNRVPCVNLLKYPGDGSYALYLFHIFSVAAVWAVMKRLLDVNQPLSYLAGTAKRDPGGIGVRSCLSSSGGAPATDGRTQVAARRVACANAGQR